MKINNIKNGLQSLMQKSTIWIVLPTFWGCQGGGGGGGSTLGSLFSNTPPTAGGEVILSPLATTLIDNGVSGATGVITNPEPTTLLLLGSGFLLMSCFKNCKFDK